MNHKDIQQIAIIYGKKHLIQEFLEIFNMDRTHDGAPLNAVLAKGDLKKELKKWLWKGD
ncbi:MAG: hypothetical protein U9O94_00915 [Nanoarchaeota archaeon]|nr:hypothetical protein [Nanoarchaeota archaeon]